MSKNVSWLPHCINLARTLVQRQGPYGDSYGDKARCGQVRTRLVELELSDYHPQVLRAFLRGSLCLEQVSFYGSAAASERQVCEALEGPLLRALRELRRCPRVRTVHLHRAVFLDGEEGAQAIFDADMMEALRPPAYVTALEQWACRLPQGRSSAWAGAPPPPRVADFEWQNPFQLEPQ